MKKANKTAKDELVTKSYFDQTLDRRFKEHSEGITERIIRYIDYRLEPLELMAKDYAQFKDKVLTSLDWLVGAFKKFEDEHTLLTERYIEINKRLENLKLDSHRH